MAPEFSPDNCGSIDVETVVGSLLGARLKCSDTVLVTDPEGRLEGIVRINDLLANQDRKISDIARAAVEKPMPRVSWVKCQS
jgi:magnesium transporter